LVVSPRVFSLIIIGIPLWVCCCRSLWIIHTWSFRLGHRLCVGVNFTCDCICQLAITINNEIALFESGPNSTI